MTVADLIAYLSDVPANALVVLNDWEAPDDVAEFVILARAVAEGEPVAEGDDE